MLLEARNLSKSIGTKSLFQEVTFSIVEGEKIALIGRNGCRDHLAEEGQ